MESIVNAALVGSARASVDEALPAATPVGRLVGSLAAETAEQRLLLVAGLRAIYRLAGYAPERLDMPMEPAPAETKAICSADVANLMHQLFAARAHDLLREALGRMGAAGLILPPEMLPLALGSATVVWDREMIALRPMIAQAVGERGAWLGGFNNAWAWVRDLKPHQFDEMAANADTIWQEGTPTGRLSVLAYWRAADPAKARAEIAAIWRQEKAEFRVDLAEALAANLSPNDEPLLETLLDDRSGNVRAVAQRLLARIPGSGYRARAASRADALLSMNKKKLVTTLPADYEKSWERDGIAAKAPQGRGERSWWLTQLIAITPPAHWAERFGLSPADLIAAATDEHAADVLEGWSRATVLYDARDWVPPLMDAWRKRRGRRDDLSLMFMLLPKLPRSTLEAMALKILEQGEAKQDIPWKILAPLLPRPWSVDLARAWLVGLRAFASGLASWEGSLPDWWKISDKIADDNYSGSIVPSVLPPECLDESLAPWDIGENKKTWQALMWREQHDRFLKAVRLRQRIRDEIPGRD